MCMELCQDGKTGAMCCMNGSNGTIQLSNNMEYKGSGRGGLSTPPSSVVGNALVVIDDGIRECEREEPLPRGARLSTEGKL